MLSTEQFESLEKHFYQMGVMTECRGNQIIFRWLDELQRILMDYDIEDKRFRAFSNAGGLTAHLLVASELLGIGRKPNVAWIDAWSPVYSENALMRQLREMVGK